MGKKVYGKRGKSIRFPLFQYTFFPIFHPCGKMGKYTFFPWAKMGLDPPIFPMGKNRVGPPTIREVQIVDLLQKTYYYYKWTTEWAKRGSLCLSSKLLDD